MFPKLSTAFFQFENPVVEKVGSALGLSQLCSVFYQLCYSIMLHFLINYASKCTNYASYYDQLFSHKDIRFSLKMQCKTKE